MKEYKFDDKIEALLPRYCDGHVTDEERKQVEDWMNESADNQRIARQFFMLYLSADTLNVMKKVDTEKALAKVKIRLLRKNGTLAIKWFQRVAAVLLFPLIISILVQLWRNNEPAVPQMMEMKTNPGMTALLTLADGTVVFLNSESSLAYPSSFNGNTREVTLKGEAYFEVAKNPDKRFIVSTPHQSRIEVLGTSFNVEAYEEHTYITTTLIEGKVGFSFEENDASKYINLSPGQKLVYDSENNKISLYQTSGASEVAWKDGKIILNNTSLEEALRMLEKRYGVEFIIKNERLKKSAYTGTFTNQRLEKILEYFKISSKIRWKYISDEKNENKKERIEIY